MKTPKEFRQGFTLIELLVVIAIIALLASLVVPAVGRALGSAKTTMAISGIKQSGTFLMADAVEQRGWIRVHVVGSSSGMGDFRLFEIVRSHLPASSKDDVQLSKIVRTPAWYHSQIGNLSSWEVWGVNYEDNPDNGVYWVQKLFPGYPQNVYCLDISRVVSPSRFPLLADNADDQGKPRTRFTASNGSGYSFAMRYNERGPIFTLDGSAKMIGVDQMAQYDLRAGWIFHKNNPATDPLKLVMAY